MSKHGNRPIQVFISCAVISSALFLIQYNHLQHSFNLTQKNSTTNILTNINFPESILTKNKQATESSKDATNRVQLLLNVEEKNIYNFTNSTVSENTRLKKITDQLSKAELIKLKDFVLDTGLSVDQRYIALHLLILSNLKSHELLNEIFFTNHELLVNTYPVHSVQEYLKEVELNIRTLAIEQIEKNIFLTKNSPNTLHIMGAQQSVQNKYLLSLLKVVQASDKINTPLLSQFMNSTLKGNFDHD